MLTDKSERWKKVSERKEPYEKYRSDFSDSEAI